MRDLAARMKELGVKPEIEVFDLAMLYAAVQLSQEERLAVRVLTIWGLAKVRRNRR